MKKYNIWTIPSDVWQRELKKIKLSPEQLKKLEDLKKDPEKLKAILNKPVSPPLKFNRG